MYKLVAAAVALVVVAVGANARVGAGPGSVLLLVKFKPGISGAQRSSVLSGAGTKDERTIAAIGVHVVSVPAASAALALGRLHANRSIQFAERDALAKPQDQLPSDPFFPQQYALSGGAWGWYTTHTTQAWDITRGDPSVVVAILDTGLKNVPDFAGQTVPGWNVLNGSPDTSSGAGNHGTYVAGAAGLAAGNGVGNAGYCPGCKIMPVQVGTDSGAAYSDMASGITWAADHGARVENLSWAGTSSSATLANAVSYARSKGVVVVAAAGNTNCDCPSYPAATAGVLGVAGTTNTDTKQGDSNYGSWVTLAAPESNMTAWPVINGAPGYAPVGGTSLAAPVIAGIAGLLFSYDTSITGARVEQALESSATPVSFSVAYGRVDALAALQSLGATDPQPSSAPVNTTAPGIFVQTANTSDTTWLGTAPQVGQVLVRGQGGWTGSAPLSLAGVKWQRCDSAGANCAAVGSSAKYTVQSADAGYALKLSITVKNGIGSVTAVAPISQPVGGNALSAPQNTVPPAISGLPQDGQLLSSTNGSWTGNPTSYAYQWQRCDTAGASCADVVGATGSSYQLGSTDVASTIRVRVTASNSGGSNAATSAATAVVAALAPQNTAPPAVSGSAQDGQTLSATPGSWSGTAPLAYTYQWQRCDATGANCADLVGATASSYQAVSSDVGSTLRVTVTASNSAGSTSATSLPSPVVAALPPASLSPPSVSGTASQGQTLQSSTGAWTGTPPLAYGYQWQRCDSTGASCATIAGATTSSYTVGSADVGSTIRAAVTATNSGGSASAMSPQTVVVAGSQQNQTFTGTLSAKTGSPSFAVTIGAGEADATLAFSKAAKLTIQLLDSRSVVVAQSGGSSSPLVLKVPGLAAGPYKYVVSGSGYKGSVSFTLSVTAPVP